MARQSRRHFLVDLFKGAGVLLVGPTCSKKCPSESLGMDYLCSSCRQLVYPLAVGTCSGCGRMTSSIALKLCNSCGCKLDKCQHCLGSL
ncbi:MAG: hypothetical protein ACUVV5_06560 [Candidatus Aminicenantales bacterium]